MDLPSILVGGAVALAAQLTSHLLSARKDRAQRAIVHYEARLVAVRAALVRFEDWAEHLDSGRADFSDLEHADFGLVEPFGEKFADEAARALLARDNGDSYRDVVARMKAHVADLEKKTGVPKRLT